MNYHGFETGLCCPACGERFRKLSTREKDAFIGRFVEPSGAGCAVTAGCPTGSASAYITHEGKAAQVCCEPCLSWWEHADTLARSTVFAKNVLGQPVDDRPSGERPARIVKTTRSDTIDVPASSGGVVLRVGGMTCQACTSAVEKALASVPGIDSVGVSLEKNLAWAGFEPGRVKEDELIDAVTAVGFTASVIPNAVVRRAAERGDTDSLDLPVCGVPIEARRVADLDRVATEDATLVSIGDSLEPIVSRFNADADRPRVVALLSPTCGGCLHGARALQREIIEAYPGQDVSVLVVWEPMLASDNEDAARQAATIFDDPRVHQFWDGDRLSGIAYSNVFPTRMQQVAEAMPADHVLSRRFRNAADVPPDRMPMWDFAAFYPADIKWRDAPPRPMRWIRQLAIMMTEDGSRSATLLTDDFSQPPVESDWFDEVRREMSALLGVRAAFDSGVSLASDDAPPYRLGVGLQGCAEGLSVGFLVPDGPGERAGLQPGDVLTSINGEPVRADTAVTTLDALLGAPDPITFGVRRDDDTLSVELVPEPRKASSRIDPAER